jgi:hypothetical protein
MVNILSSNDFNKLMQGGSSFGTVLSLFYPEQIFETI